MGTHVWIDDRQEDLKQMLEQNEQHAETKEEKYLTYLKGQKKYYSDRSKKYKRYYQGLLLFSSIGALIVPVLIVTDIPKIIPTILSALVSIGIAVENLFHFGDNWRIFRQTLEGLRQEQVLYDNHVGPYVDALDPFKLFVERTMTIMNSETTIYFEINKQKDQDSKTNQTPIVAKN
jgi:uncharacterized protein DUF4231